MRVHMTSKTYKRLRVSHPHNFVYIFGMIVFFRPKQPIWVRDIFGKNKKCIILKIRMRVTIIITLARDFGLDRTCGNCRQRFLIKDVIIDLNQNNI